MTFKIEDNELPIQDLFSTLAALSDTRRIIMLLIADSRSDSKNDNILNQTLLIRSQTTEYTCAMRCSE
jgi:hypothetical protein